MQPGCLHLVRARAQIPAVPLAATHDQESPSHSSLALGTPIPSSHQFQPTRPSAPGSMLVDSTGERIARHIEAFEAKEANSPTPSQLSKRAAVPIRKRTIPSPGLFRSFGPWLDWPFAPPASGFCSSQGLGQSAHFSRVGFLFGVVCRHGCLKLRSAGLKSVARESRGRAKAALDGRGNAQNNLVLGQAFVDSLTLDFILVGKVHPILISGKQIAAMTPKR